MLTVRAVRCLSCLYEGVGDHGGPADEEGDGDGGHQQVDAPPTLLHRLVRAGRPAGREEEEEFKSWSKEVLLLLQYAETTSA